MKIGVFDSGVGGITVLAELGRQFCGAEYVYLGDTANVPYGPKSPSQIEKLSSECAKILKNKNIDVLVVACNTASSWALNAIEEIMHPIPVFGVVSPGVDAVLTALKEIDSKELMADSGVLVLATRATVQSQAYGKALRQEVAKNFANPIKIIEQACPLLVPMIEEGWIEHPILNQTILEYVRPYLTQYQPGIVLLGCTHYPWIHSAFEKMMPGWRVINSAMAVVNSLQRSSVFQKLNSSGNTTQIGTVEWIFTDPDSVPGFAKKLIQSQKINQLVHPS